MRGFFSSKVNILLTFLLTTVIGAAIFFTLMYFNGKDKLLVPDFSGKTQYEVETWCKSLDTNPCSFTSDYSDTVEKDYVIYQSIKVEDELKDNISFIISLGKKDIIALPTIDENTTKETIIEWANTNNITNITYIDEESNTVEVNHIIRIEPSSDITADTSITVYVSTGKAIEVNSNGVITVEADCYIKLSEQKFIDKVKALGLTPSYVSKKDDYSNTVDKGCILWHGSGDYIKDEEIHYSLSLGKKDGEDIVIEADEFVGKTEEEVKEIISKLGLTPNHGHSTYKDEYSDKYEKGTVIWHGSGTYEKDEKFNYVLSLGKKDSSTVYVSSGTYVGKTEEELKTAITKLGLTPNHGHSTYKDEYSDKYAKGVVIWHGSGTYEKNEKFNYVLSLGSAPKVDVANKAGVSESEFKTYLNGLGLKVGTRTTEYSDSVAEGLVISNTTGTVKGGSTISYVVSLGKDTRVDVPNYAGQLATTLESFISINGLKSSSSSSYSDTVAKDYIISNTNGMVNAGSTIKYVVSLGQEKFKLMLPEYYEDEMGSTFEETKNNLSNGVLRYFTNVTYVKETSNLYNPGVIMYIKVGDNQISSSDWYTAGTNITVGICNKTTNTN